MATDKEYQTNIEILLERIRANTAETEINTDNLALDVSVDGLETCCGATNTLLSSLITLHESTISGDETQVDIVSGTVTANLGSVDNALLDAMIVDLAALEVLLTAANVDHAANEVLLTGIDSDTNLIKTSLDNIDNAVDGNYLNVNANIAGTDFVGGAGAVASGVQRTTLASDDPAVALLATIDADTTYIKIKIASLEVLSTAANVDHAANEVLLTGIDADTDAIKTDIAALEVLSTAANVDLAAMEVDLAALEVLSTAANVDLAAIEVDLAALEVLSTAANVDHAANEALLQKIVNNQLLMLGNSGMVTISGTTAVSVSAGTYCAVNFIKASTPGTLTIPSQTTIAAVEYPAGTWIYGDITDITCNAGSLYVLYKGNPA